MRTLIYLIIGLVITTLSAQTAHDKMLTVTITNVLALEGSMHVSLNTEATFMKAAPIQSFITKVEGNTVKVIFEHVPKGEYGILVFHDKNDNGKMDFQTNGMPIEPYGISNNGAYFGPPTWNDAKFNVENDLALEIRL